MKDIAPLIEQSLKAIRKAQSEFDVAIAEAQTLVRQSGQQHADGDLDGARDSAMDAGDILHNWVGDSDAISDLEEALWEGDDEAWEKRTDERLGRRD